MATIDVRPLPQWYRKFLDRNPSTDPDRPLYLHAPPPIFVGGEPTEADMRLAIELINALDADSQRWYRYRLRAIREKLEAAFPSDRR